MARKIKVTRFNTVDAPDSAKGRRIMFIGVALILVLVGFLLGRAFSPRKQAATVENKTSVSEVKTGYGPFDTKGVVPAKFDHSTQGAIAAASTYIGNTPRYYLLKDSPFKKAISTISSAGYFDTLYTGINSNRAIAQKVFSDDPDAFYREIPLGYAVMSEDKDEVTINVWSQVMIVAKPSFNGITESALHTMTLVWEKGDWKISSWTNQPGPTPRWQSKTDPLTVDDFIATVQPFTGGYDYAPSF